MGRKPTLTLQDRRIRQRERDRKKRLDPEKLAKKRGQDRERRRRERDQQARQTAYNPLTLLSDTATQARLLEEIGDDDDDDGEVLGEIRSAAECTEVSTGSFEDESTFIQLHGDGEGFNLVGIHANSRNPC